MFSAWIKRYGRSLSLRISLWYALGFVASFLLIGVFARWMLNDAGQSSDRREIMEEFNQDAARCRLVGSAGFRAERMHEVFDAEATLIRLSAPDGHTLLFSPQMGVEPEENRWVEKQLALNRRSGWQSARLPDGKNGWHYYGMPMPDGGWLQVAKSDRRNHETRAQLVNALLPVTALVVLLATTGAAGLTSRALQPLRQLINTTRTVINSGDMTARVPVTRATGGHELDELGTLFNRMLAHNESLIRGMRDALDNVAHDLRTPLTRLRSSAEAALRDSAATLAERGDALADVIEESERVLATLRTLMDISEAEHGTMLLHPENIELAPFAATAADLYEYAAEALGVRLRLNVPPGLNVTADRVRLQQVVANLLDNAIKYGNPGGEVEIAAGAGADHQQGVWFRVRDQGSGIAAHDLPRIWDRLYRGDHSRSTRGTGLGLSLVKAVVEAHGGRAMVESEPGCGSTFTIFLSAEARPARA